MTTTTLLLIVLGAIALFACYWLFIRRGARPVERIGEARPRPPERPAERLEPRAPKEPAAVPPPKAEAPPVAPKVPAKLEPAAEAALAPAPLKEAAPAALAPLREAEVAALKQGLTTTRGGLIGRLGKLFRGKKELDPALVAQIEEVMLTSDVGVKTTQKLLDRLKEKLGKADIGDPRVVWSTLREETVRILDLPAGAEPPGKPQVIMVVGVNGVGKTTTIGKLASRLSAEGKKVVLAAGDTFRAAAVQQLEIWGRRTGCAVVKGKEGADPSSVIFDAVKAATQDGADVVIADTAGRLHTKQPLMDELKKVKRVAAKALEGAPHQTLLVLDSTNGQNAIAQAQMFKEALDVSGIVLTKLDGTAKGGVILGICDEHRIPVRFIGIGERVEDLREFHAREFVEALFFQAEEESIAA
ncbi:MAG: signal recognition particle-docking protein FtsY [Deltaproteobacteria bacterium]|nr:signal recognition particle-docking protein FtsY [Deltaproteobacteria bacterium]